MAINRVPDVGQATDRDPALTVRPCRYCEAPVTQPTGRYRNMAKHYCTNRCRSAYREREHQNALAMAVEAIDALEDAVEQVLAKMQGAKQVLMRFQKGDRRKRT